MAWTDAAREASAAARAGHSVKNGAVKAHPVTHTAETINKHNFKLATDEVNRSKRNVWAHPGTDRAGKLAAAGYHLAHANYNAVYRGAEARLAGRKSGKR